MKNKVNYYLTDDISDENTNICAVLQSSGGKASQLEAFNALKSSVALFGSQTEIIADLLSDDYKDRSGNRIFTFDSIPQCNDKVYLIGRMALLDDRVRTFYYELPAETPPFLPVIDKLIKGMKPTFFYP